MKTEMQQLKENTEQQFIKERFDELHKELHALYEIRRDRLYWAARSRMLTHFVAAMMLVIILVNTLLGYPDIAALYEFTLVFIFMVTLLRSHEHENRLFMIQGRIDGFIQALQILKIVPENEPPAGRKKRKRAPWSSPFRRFKEFFERMESKDKQEQYA